MVNVPIGLGVLMARARIEPIAPAVQGAHRRMQLARNARRGLTHRRPDAPSARRAPRLQLLMLVGRIVLMVPALSQLDPITARLPELAAVTLRAPRRHVPSVR